MEQKKISEFIKHIRKVNNLTQKELADKYNVTYQAVSKWENGKNLPDMLLINQMSKDFNVSLDDIFAGEYNVKKTKNKRWFNLIYVILIISLIVLFFIGYKNKDFEFKTISTECGNFNISGIISYNNKKSAIYIDNVEYCGGDDTEEYKNIECGLYEVNNDIVKKISTCNYNKNKNITLEVFLENINFTVNSYSQVCKDFSENNLFLEINATNKNNKTTSYKIPLSLNEKCSD